MADPTPDRRLLQVLVDFAGTVVTDYTAGEALDRLLAQVPPLLGVDGAGVMLEDEGGELRFVAASDEVVRLIEAFQVETGQGPCVLAYESGMVVQVDDLTADPPFPDFARVALARGMAAVHSFPMLCAGARVGALNLYRTTPGPLPEEGIEVGQLFADVATTYLLSARRTDRLTQQVDGLRAVLAESGAIDQAKGVLMHAHGLDDRAAFGLLRQRARQDRRRVLDVARAVMAGEIGPEELGQGQVGPSDTVAAE